MDPISSILGLVSTIISRIWPDKSEADKAKFLLEFQKNLSEADIAKAQIAVNANEAANPNIFVSGWRPWIGWGLGTIVVFYALLTTIVNFAIALKFAVIPFPPLDPMVRDIVMGMLGLNIGARTFEKWQNGKK